MTTLIQLEILRTLRNKRYLMFTVLYPALLYVFFINAYSGGEVAGGVPAKSYFMVSMATFGAVGAVLTGSAQRISLERKSGWTRQLRLTALPGRAYTVGKIAACAVTTLPAIAVVFAIGAVEGVRLGAAQWLGLGLALWLGSFVFAALGVALGYAAQPDAVQPMVMIVYMLMALFGGTWFPVSDSLKAFARFNPVYLYNQSASFTRPGHTLDTVAVAGLAGFLALFVAAAAYLYRQDTKQA
ncbi:ABC transporter [Kitasatospora herbaricolor]|uniref:ABC transporter permease n=1 Tax=Kitasatospora herbaricolor TaxID=68217 RepID=UPI00174E0EF2|nr:ABC transporter permease [Kitasatospora herbaricolor]MDQ0310425.1 ABC-2 type transport system permease protein [Kitasatospora herbaricolor]GGV07217.1 ABC transporter [Kitasatospora herbaricolor]